VTKTGAEIVARAIEAPLRQLAANAGVEGALIVAEVKKGKGNHGYNVATGEYEDLIKAGVVDPSQGDPQRSPERRLHLRPPPHHRTPSISLKHSRARSRNGPGALLFDAAKPGHGVLELCRRRASGHQMNIYLETSVFGGYFDPEFQHWTKQLFDRIADRRFGIIISATLLEELKPAPAQVRDLLDLIPDEKRIILPPSEEIEALRDAYLAEKLLPAKFAADAEHIACASVAGAAAIVSWNFKHIVNFGRIPGYHVVNARNGYPALQIITPIEALGDEDIN
jgi:hypothetical protein